HDQVLPRRTKVDRHRRLLRGLREDPEGSRLDPAGRPSRSPGPNAGLLPRAPAPIPMTTPPPVLPADPRAGYLARKQEIDAAIAAVLTRGSYILGEDVIALEREFAAYLGVKHCIGVASGTDAVHLALRACGLAPGDEVVTVSHTAVATVAAIEMAGATPVLVDIDASFTIDPAAVRAP